MSFIAIGDVHGCAGSLERLLDELEPTADDHLVFIGDYVDRGPDSRGVLSRLIRLKDEARCTFIRGNHDQMMLDYVDHGEFALWRVNGGLATLSSYMQEGRLHIPDEHVTFLRDTRLFFDTPDYLFVHAGLNPRFSVAHNLQYGGSEMFLWERGHVHAEEFAWEKTVVCGHTPHSEPVNLPKLINVDTGCVYHTHEEFGRLTAVRLPDRKFVHVNYSG
jgi:serine/threonine protein phosphatase 1